MGNDVLVVTDFRPLPEVAGLPPLPAVPGHDNVSQEVETGVDVTVALEEALEAASPKHALPGHTADRYDVATTILFPALPLGFTYLVSRTVRIPQDKNLRLAAQTPRAVRLRVLEPPEAAIRSGGAPGRASVVSRTHLFENLVFHGGGVAIEEDARGQTSFVRCAFHGIDDWSIRTEGPGVVGVDVVGCDFSESRGGGVQVGHSGCDNWIIGDGSTFVRLGLEGVEVRSSGVHVRDALFETKIPQAGGHPYIRVADSLDQKVGQPQFSGGTCRISACRFGGEVGSKVHGPPAYAIDLTPDRSKAILGVQVEQNWFLGWTGGQQERPPDSARAAIRTGRRAHLCTVNGNYFRRHQYLDAVIDDTPDNNVEGLGPPGINAFVGNAVDLGGRVAPTRADIFPGGVGSGWEVLPPG